MINVPQADTESLRKLYGELLGGKKPEQIIAEHGFHPELVENENQRFQRLVENDINSLISKFFANFEEDLRNANNNSTISLLSQKYTNERRLTVDELMNLIKSLLTEKYRSGEAYAIHNLVKGNVPYGWQSMMCDNCANPIRGAIMDNANTMSITLTYKNIVLSHGALGMPCPK